MAQREPAPEPSRDGPPVLLPFAASVVRQGWAESVVSPAYDGLGVEERRALLLEQPDSYMHATRSPEDVGYALSPAELVVLNQMALIRLLRLNAFESRPAPAVYVYRITGYGSRQRGVVGVVPLEAYRRGQIRPHERTHADREELLSEFLALTSAQSSPWVSLSGELPVSGRCSTRSRPPRNPCWISLMRTESPSESGR